MYPIPNRQYCLLPLDSLELELGSENEPTNPTLQQFLHELGEQSPETDSKTVIQQIVTFYIETKGNKALQQEVREVIIELFSRYNTKKQLRKYVQDLVIKQNLLNEIIKSSAQFIMQKIKDEKTCNVRKCNEFLHFVSVMQIPPEYDFEENFRPLFPLYISLVDSFGLYASQLKQDNIPEIEELNTLMNAVLKQILPVFVKNITFLQEIKELYLKPLMMYSYILLFNEKIRFDLRMKVCLIFIYAYDVSERGILSVAQLISKNSSPFSLVVNPANGEETPSDYLIILYSSIISVLPEERIISEKVDGKPLICVLYEGILETAKSNPGPSPYISIVETSRTLCQVVKHLKNVPIASIKPLFLESLFYVSSHIDHFIDTVRKYSKMFFEGLVALAVHHYDKGFVELTDLMMEKIDDIPEESTMRFLAYEYIGKYYGCEFLLKKFEHLPLILLESIDNSTVTDQVSKTYQALLERSYTSSSVDSESQWAKTWVMPAINLLKSGRQCEQFCQKIISAAFKLQPAILRMIFPNDYIGTAEESRVLLHRLHNARKNGIELTLEKDRNLYWRGLIDKQKLDMFMIHQNEEIRLLVLASVAESLKSTDLFLDWEFLFLLNYIRYNITAQTPSMRKQIISYYKKILARYNAGYKVIQKHNFLLTKAMEERPSTGDKQKLALNQELKKSYRRFIYSLTTILIGNLSYDSNFPRRATSLELLLAIRDILSPDDWKSCWHEEDVKSSHNILFDTYENNKKMVVKLLKTLPPHYLGFTNVSFTFKYMQRSIDLAMDVKPSKTLSAAYLFEVCSYSPYFYDIVHCECGEEATKKNDPTLDMIVVLTRKFINQSSEIKVENIGTAKTAVYGLILSIRHLLESREIDQHNETYAGIFDHLVTTCFSISDKIMPVVCNPSPEGYLPENVEDFCENDESPRAQKVLVYAWRTMKEMTLLLAEIVKQTIKVQTETAMLSEETLKKIGEFFVNVFIHSKHRGVFEQAYVGFSVVCENFWKSSNENIVRLVPNWLQQALDLCTGKVHSEDLCSTRRSAGLPFLILSILTTEPSPTHFHATMVTLFKIFEDQANCTDDTRMHCLNILRALFRHSKLGELVAPYVAKGVILAISGFKSEAWGVRNSSTLLFSALMTRMFGVQRTTDSENLCIKNKLTVNVLFLRYQELYTFILNTLAEECHNSSSLVLQPILMILSRLYASNFDEGPHKASEYLPYIDACLANPVYRTREAAAKASVALINPKEVKSYMDKCFSKISNPKISDNECHGILLQMLYVLRAAHENVLIEDLPFSTYLKQTCHIWENGERKFSHMTIGLYTEFVQGLLINCQSFDDLSWLKRILLYLSKCNKRQTCHALTWRGNFTITGTVLAYYIIVNKLEETDFTCSTITNEIMSILYGPEAAMKKFCLELLISLNRMYLIYKKIENVAFRSTMVRFSTPAERGYMPKVDTRMEQHPLFTTGEIKINDLVRVLAMSFSRQSVAKIVKHIHPYLKGFLIEEVKIQQYVCEEDRVLLFLLLNYYPCSIRYLRLSKQETLNTLLNYCDCDNEELISAVISCISTFIEEEDFYLLKYDKLLEMLSKSASPAAALHRRLAVCAFLCKNHTLYCSEEPILKGDQLCKIINIVMVLLEDEDLDVRNAMSNYENALKVRIKINDSMNQTIPGDKWPVVPEKAKEDLIHLITMLMPQERAVCMIFSWACRYFPDPNTETQEIFERGGLNQYAENTPLIDVCSRVLIKMLWALPEGLSYDDKTIFIEEQTQIVTATLINALMKYDSPMMITKTKMSVIVSLQSLYKFLENTEINGNFANNFNTYLEETILTYLTNHLEHGDLFCVKKLFKRLYDPVFRQRR